MSDKEKPGCYQWKCRLCHANGVFQSQALAEAEGEAHKRDFGAAHTYTVIECE